MKWRVKMYGDDINGKQICIDQDIEADSIINLYGVIDTMKSIGELDVFMDEIGYRLEITRIG